MAKCIMVQGTMSGAGKSFLVTALCRIFARKGYRVAPFKSQNMALNSYITADGLEIGRAQAAQAEAAGIAPDVRMNPILLKPNSDTGSQLIVNGTVRGNYPAREYFAMKPSLVPDILAAYQSLAAENDIIVIEGAGSPAEINLRDNDIVNMGLAELVDAPVLLAGDIDPGGVFAQLYGTMMLLSEQERRRVIGTVINRFRGDVSLLRPGLAQLESLTGVPVLGVVPYARVELDDEDSLSSRLRPTDTAGCGVDVAIIRLPHLSNFTDFAPLERHPDIGIRYVSKSSQLGFPDLVILPGTKSTMADLQWIRKQGLEDTIRSLWKQGVLILGVCGGYQMLGQRLSDSEGVEQRGDMPGMGLLPTETVFSPRKTRMQVEGMCALSGMEGIPVTGYELHMGTTTCSPSAHPFCRRRDGTPEGAVTDRVWGTYLHGLFDSAPMVNALAERLLLAKGLLPTGQVMEDQFAYRQQQYDKMADLVENSLDMERIYREMERFHGK